MENVCCLLVTYKKNLKCLHSKYDYHLSKQTNTDDLKDILNNVAKLKDAD